MDVEVNSETNTGWSPKACGVNVGVDRLDRRCFNCPEAAK
jgi:hypothetical protein